MGRLRETTFFIPVFLQENRPREVRGWTSRGSPQKSRPEASGLPPPAPLPQISLNRHLPDKRPHSTPTTTLIFASSPASGHEQSFMCLFKQFLLRQCERNKSSHFTHGISRAGQLQGRANIKDKKPWTASSICLVVMGQTIPCLWWCWLQKPTPVTEMPRTKYTHAPKHNECT